MNDRLDISEIFLKGPFVGGYCNQVTVWNILMKLYRNVYEVTKVCRIQKKIGLLFFVSILFLFD